MAIDLKGRLAVITGASAGIGAATAHELARLGARLVIGARRLDRLDEVRDSILEASPGTDVWTVPLDVADAGSCADFARVAERKGDVEIVVNNAGLARGKDHVVDASEADWREMIDTNLLGLLRITRLFLPGLIARKGGTVVHLGSVAGLEAYPGGAVYCATKAGVRSITKALRHELLGTGVRVCNVEPGAAETEFSEVRFRGDRAKASQVYEGFTPLSAQDVAEAIAFAVSRPPHVDVEELVIYPTAQAGAMATHRSRH